MTDQCALCAHRERQMDRLHQEVLELRLAVAEGRPTVEARRDLETVNQKLAAANTKIAGLEARLYRRDRNAS